MTEPFRSTVVDPARLRVSHSDYSNLSPADKRRTIKMLLDKTNFAICPELVSAQQAGRHTAIPSRTPAKAIVHGVTGVIGSVDGSEYNYRIEYGKPLCFDMVTGQAVTGLNPAWGPGEYKIVGTSLGDLSSGRGRVPILMGVSPSDPFSIVARPKVKEGSYPDFFQWSGSESMEQQQAVWQFELPSSYIYNETVLNGAGQWQGSGIYAKALNLSRQYIYNDTFVLLHSSGKPTLQFWCDFYMGQTIMGTLQEDLYEGHFAIVDIDQDFQAGLGGDPMVWVWDKMLRQGTKLKPGTRVTASLMRRSAGGWCWQYFVTQANQCPVKDQ